MKLRKLKEIDAPLMFEWMHDDNVGSKLATNFNGMTIEDCSLFIKNSVNNDKNIHMAICNDDDEYLGTVSLKNINVMNSNAEFAICLRSKAIGTGTAIFATNEILKIAFMRMNIHRVYLCVFSENIRAISFYKKYGFIFEGEFREHIMKTDGKYHNLQWFSILAEEFLKLQHIKCLLNE